MRQRIANALGIAALVAMSCGGAARPVGADKGGSGHYLPGGAASFIDTLPGRAALEYLNEITYYYGSASGLLPLSGQIVARMDANVWADTSLLLWESPWKIGDFEYAAAAAIPCTWVAVDATVQGSFGLSMPTGSYDGTRLANVGKNYCTFEPPAAFSHIGREPGRELTALVAFDLSTENGATNYTSGDLLHVDATLAQHLPLLGGFADEAKWLPDLDVEERLKGG